MLVILFQPTLDRLEEKREKTVQVAIQRGVERAAIDGYFTRETIDEMMMLLESVGYEEEDVTFYGTEEQTLRGQYVEGSIEVPNQFQFLLLENYLTGEVEDKSHYHFASRMSEYIP